MSKPPGGRSVGSLNAGAASRTIRVSEENYIPGLLLSTARAKSNSRLWTPIRRIDRSNLPAGIILTFYLPIPAAVIETAIPSAARNVAAHAAVGNFEPEPGLAELLSGDALKVATQAGANLVIPFIHISTDYVFDRSKPAPCTEDGPMGRWGPMTAPKPGARRRHSRGRALTIFRTVWADQPKRSVLNILNSIRVAALSSDGSRRLNIRFRRSALLTRSSTQPNNTAFQIGRHALGGRPSTLVFYEPASLSAGDGLKHSTAQGSKATTDIVIPNSVANPPRTYQRDYDLSAAHSYWHRREAVRDQWSRVATRPRTF